MAKVEKNWYVSWFDTEYYHILYQDRDYKEAQAFIQNLVDRLGLEKGAHLLDLACGKGRHAIYLHQLGFDVTGVDLSKNSIQKAKTHEKPGLHFEVHNMCEPFNQKFDAVLNLFTSFGYFEKKKDNVQTLRAIKKDLKPNGFGVIDFMNTAKTIKNLVPEETKTIDGIDFHLKRWVEDGFILKKIDFEDQGEKYSFTERVKSLTLPDFKNLFEKTEAQLLHTYGDYQLNNFEEETSDRLILIFQ